MKSTYVEAVEAFLEKADWLGEEEEPAVTGLMKCAEQLDSEFQASTFAQFTMTHRYLMKKKPVTTSKEEEDDDLLTEFD